MAIFYERKCPLFWGANSNLGRANPEALTHPSGQQRQGIHHICVGVPDDILFRHTGTEIAPVVPTGIFRI